MRFFSYLVCLVGIVDSFKHLAMNSRSFELNTIPIRDPFDKINSVDILFLVLIIKII